MYQIFDLTKSVIHDGKKHYVVPPHQLVTFVLFDILWQTQVGNSSHGFGKNEHNKSVTTLDIGENKPRPVEDVEREKQALQEFDESPAVDAIPTHFSTIRYVFNFKGCTAIRLERLTPDGEYRVTDRYVCPKSEQAQFENIILDALCSLDLGA